VLRLFSHPHSHPFFPSWDFPARTNRTLYISHFSELSTISHLYEARQWGGGVLKFRENPHGARRDRDAGRGDIVLIKLQPPKRATL